MNEDKVKDVSLLFAAIADCQQDIALGLLSAGADVHTTNEHGWTALHWACHKGLPKVAQELIKRGSGVNLRDRCGRSPLMLAQGVSRVVGGNEDTAIRLGLSLSLLRAGAVCKGLSQPQIDELFRYACNKGVVSVVHTLLDNGCNVSLLTKLLQDQLLCCAYYEGDRFVIRTLLENGCNVTALSEREQEELFLRACHDGDKSVVQTVLKNGCILSSRNKGDLLWHACHEGDAFVIQIFVVHTLLENGCSLSVLSSWEQEEILRHACSEDDVFVVRSVLKNGCNLGILSREEQDKLLCLTTHEGDIFVIHTLLKNGCSLSALSKQAQEELLCHACHEGDLFVVRILLKNGCNLSILSREVQEELLRRACHERNIFVIRTLLENGCNLGVLCGELPEELLCCACNEGDVLVAQALLKNGCRGRKLKQADVVYLMDKLSGQEMKQLLHQSRHNGDVFAFHTLLENGCVGVLSSEEQEELLCHACHEGDVFVVRILLKNGCNLSVLSRETQEELLRRACHERNIFVIRTLLENGCNLGVLCGELPEELLCCACNEGDVLVARALLKNGCRGRKLKQADIVYLMHNLSGQEMKQLLHQSRHNGDVFAFHTLLENGCVGVLSSEEQEELLCHACHEGDVFVVRILLKNGCNLSVLSREAQEELLRRACHEGDIFVVHTLLENGCRVTVLSKEEQEGLLCHNCHEGDISVAHTLLENGCSVTVLSKEEQEGLLRRTCHKGDIFVAQTLLENGCSVTVLSKEEQEGLLCHNCHEGDISVAHTLLENGCSISVLSREEQEDLLCQACLNGDVFVAQVLLKKGCSGKKLKQAQIAYLMENLSQNEVKQFFYQSNHRDDVFVVHTLLENGCVGVLSRNEQETFLLQAFRKQDMFAVHALLENGCNVSILLRKDQNELLQYACQVGDVLVARVLLKNGCNVSILSRVDQEELLCHASHKHDMFVVRAFLKNGCSVNILSREDKEELFYHACREGDLFVAQTLLQNGCSVNILSREEQEELFCQVCRQGDLIVAQSLLKNGCDVDILSRETKEKIFCLACERGDMFVFEAVIASGCNVNCVNATGFTPLMVAVNAGHEVVVKKLILAGAIVGMQDELSGDTALHIAAVSNHIQCGILLVEAGCSERIKNNISQIPLDIAKTEFKEAMKQARSFTSRKTLCIIGNAEGGKSTLIAALQAESNSVWGKMVNRIKKVSATSQRTAGIEPITHSSQRYGHVLFFDFAGQHEYHGPHQMFMESLLSKPGVSVTLLLVVKMTDEEEAILHQLHRWLSPIALMSTTANPPQVIVIGSFLDRVRLREEATAKLTRCIEAGKKELEKELTLKFVGSCFLNCRHPQSAGIDQLCSFLQDIPIPEFRATHTEYSLAWVLSRIRSSITARAVQLEEFSGWIQKNEDNLPRAMPPPGEVCQDLSAAGYALYFPNKDNAHKSWLVLDLPSILHEVYGTLFSQSKHIVDEFGLLHCRCLAEVFPDLDLELVQQLLIGLEFCIPVDPSVLRVEVNKLTCSEEASGWLFFPSLISTKIPHINLKNHSQQSVRHLCWQLRTAEKHSISARLLQAIILRLAANFVVKHHIPKEYCCSVWWNGIEWQSTVGVDVAVQVDNRVIQVIGASLESADKLCQYFTDVISHILSSVHLLSPKLLAGTYIVHPLQLATLSKDIIVPSPKKLFPVDGIESSIREVKGFALSLKDSKNCCTRTTVTDLFGGCTLSLENIKRINWTQPEPNQTESSQANDLSQMPYCKFMFDCRLISDMFIDMHLMFPHEFALCITILAKQSPCLHRHDFNSTVHICNNFNSDTCKYIYTTFNFAHFLCFSCSAVCEGCIALDRFKPIPDNGLSRTVFSKFRL